MKALDGGDVGVGGIVGCGVGVGAIDVVDVVVAALVEAVVDATATAGFVGVGGWLDAPAAVGVTRLATDPESGVVLDMSATPLDW